VSEKPPVELIRQGDVAIVRIDSPPVNALSHAVRSGLLEAFESIERDASIRAALIVCAGRTFVAGADIKEFGKPRQKPLLNDVIDRLDTMTKPVVAAIHGTALGGGLELALGCHHRIAAPSARLGQPEVKLGILPGGGGTQRLPRAIGAVPALHMIVTGEPITASAALKQGLLQKIAEGDLTEAGIAAAKKLVGSKPHRLRDDDSKLTADRADYSAFDAAAAELTKRARGQHAPHACVDAVRAALDLPFDEGMALEQKLFGELVAGDQSKALRHIFFAEREAAKVPGLSPSIKPRTIGRAAVIGAGTMGAGIAICFADTGIEVALIETSAEALQRGLTTVETNYREAAKRGRITAAEADGRGARINGGVGLEAAANADVVIEAIFEDLALKQQVFRDLDHVTRPDAILATNTSYLDIDAIASATNRPASVAGMHFFSPANIMRLVEIARGRDTSAETLATLLALARKLGKVPVVVGNCHGFVGNRMLRQRNIATERVLLEGALPHDIDAALTDFGFPMGPLAASDLAGLDIGFRMRKAAGFRAEIADQLCERGRFGQKTGRGFYRYDPGSRAPLPDPEVEQLIVETSSRLGIARRALSNDEIVQRLLYPMINEGARILEEGIAMRSSDMDVIWTFGYGFPVWRGGPMHYADSAGLELIRDRLADLASRSNDASLQPAPLLERLAADGRGFAALAAATSSIA
jgi:3-hydroxyacyl-CoA dehydrogenase